MEKTMSLYDTIRCLKYDPAFLVEYYSNMIAALGILTIILLWGAL